MDSEARFGFGLGSSVLLFGTVCVVACMYGCPKYNVWQKGLEGKAELAQADWNRQIATLEAQAKKESAKALAEAEVIRAEGMAKANKIIGDSLHDNEDYLMYLWVQQLDSAQMQVIYIPTEAGLPLLEAGKRYEAKQPKTK